MTDTLRSKAELAALLADNTTGAITPQMLRDFLESSAPSFGAIHFTDPGGPTVLAGANTWTKCANTSSLDQASRFDSPLDNRVRYTGRATQMFRVTAALSITNASNNQVLDFAIYKSGIQVVPSIMRTKVTSGGDIKSMVIHTFVQLQTNDYLEVWCQNETSNGTITVNHGYFSAEGWLT